MLITLDTDHDSMRVNGDARLENLLEALGAIELRLLGRRLHALDTLAPAASCTPLMKSWMAVWTQHAVLFVFRHTPTCRAERADRGGQVC